MALEEHIRDSGVFLGYGIVWMQFLAEVDGNDVQRETNNAASMASFEDDLWILNEWLPQYTVSLYLFYKLIRKVGAMGSLGIVRLVHVF